MPTSRWLPTLLLGALTGCSTMSTIRSDPPGAKVYVKGVYVGETPVTVKLKDGLDSANQYWVQIKKPGYKTFKVTLPKQWSAGYLILDALICLPTLGIGCYLVYFNGKSHYDRYFYVLERGSPVPPPPAPAAPAEQETRPAPPTS